MLLALVRRIECVPIGGTYQQTVFGTPQLSLRHCVASQILERPSPAHVDCGYPQSLRILQMPGLSDWSVLKYESDIRNLKKFNL